MILPMNKLIRHHAENRRKKNSKFNNKQTNIKIKKKKLRRNFSADKEHFYFYFLMLLLLCSITVWGSWEYI